MSPPIDGLDPPQMSVDEFERLASLAFREIEGLRLEFLDGRLGAEPRPEGRHGRVIQWLVRSCDPGGARYGTVRTLPFGKTVPLPAPVGIVLDIEPLKNWVR
ncbi:hypothetical protein [Kitasatospora sp. NPDC101183]|uniref:hypothetical protein n=1 Tax=Kitasatospora sp. NPDC101183 TaxID=3364100 RepID=UPI003820D294